MAKHALTTFDNPFNPFKDFISWLMYDEEKGYGSCAYLARVTRITDQMTEEEEDDEIERGIDQIIKHDYRNIYRKVKA